MKSRAVLSQWYREHSAKTIEELVRKFNLDMEAKGTLDMEFARLEEVCITEHGNSELRRIKKKMAELEAMEQEIKDTMENKEVEEDVGDETYTDE